MGFENPFKNYIMKKTNSELYPECWDFFIDFAKNITQEDDIKHLGNYRISLPNTKGEFIYADCTGILFNKLKKEFYKKSSERLSAYGNIQYIIEKYK